MTPADEINTAAIRLRELATASTPGHWQAEELPADQHHKHPAHWVKTEYDDGPNMASSQVVADCPWKQADAAYIAAMHPAVGEALAGWLETTATSLTASTHPDWQGCVAADALAVARAINGGQP